MTFLNEMSLSLTVVTLLLLKAIVVRMTSSPTIAAVLPLKCWLIKGGLMRLPVACLIFLTTLILLGLTYLLSVIKKAVPPILVRV